ncbi:glycosyltransferase family 4 protein, partial [Patescibacteria group bacterium]
MKIGIDARFYGPIGGGGLGRYTKNLIDCLEKIDHQNEYVIFLRNENWENYNPSNHNFKKVLAPYKWYSFKEQLLMPIKIWKQKIDLMHFPHFNVPLLYPLIFKKEFVITIHDLILLKYPSKKATTLSPIYFRFKYLMYKLVISSAVKNAKKIIVPTKFVKYDILKYFKAPDNKIFVIYEGVTDMQNNNGFGVCGFNKNVDKKTDKEIKMCYNKRERETREWSASWRNEKREFQKVENGIAGHKYILYVGNAYPHKNLERLVDAFQLLVNVDYSVKLKKSGFGELALVLVGVKNYFYQQLIEYVKKNYPDLEHRIIFFGYATDQELMHLYKKSELYVFLSLQEGFGLPPLEAMSYGVPVVSSKSSCLQEVLGDS